MENRNKTNEKRIAKAFEGLVFDRFNKKGLEEKISEIVGRKVKLANIGHKEDALTDHNFMCGFDNEPKKLFGYLDVYYLKHRKAGHDGATFLVTGVAYEFE
jgi:hypothetical protein